MNQVFKISTNLFVDTIMPLAVLLIIFILGYIIRKTVFLRLSKWAEYTKIQIGDIVIPYPIRTIHYEQIQKKKE
nr:hypothetical protein [Candidatus Omnitrophota bacterium]